MSKSSRRTRDDALAHDGGSLAADDSHDPAPLLQNALGGHSVENKGGCGLRGPGTPHLRARTQDARCMYDQKCNDAAISETNYSSATDDILGKAEALEKFFYLDGDDAGSLFTKESDVFQTMLERHKLKTLSAELNAAVAAVSVEKCSGKGAFAAQHHQ